MVFAVPTEVSIGRQFTCDGVEFRVDSCDPESCTRFTIEAVCRRFEQGRCLPNGAEGRGVLGYRYTWSARTGITWIDFAPESGDGDVFLRHGAGFLATPQ